MQQHPVPQNITGFEFKLIGFLTLRQFGYLAAAAIFTFILYSAKIPIFVILVLAGPLDLLALALAFLPVNGQPFERAMAAFLKTIYSPNVRVWHREPKVLGFLEPQFSIYLQTQSNTVGEPRILSDRGKLNAYLKGHQIEAKKSLVDINEERRLKQLQFSPLKGEKEIFIAPKLADLSPNPSNNAVAAPVRLQRNDAVVAETKERTEET